MPNNNIALITKYSPDAWDKVYKQEAVTSVLDANKGMVQFTGAKTVKIAKFSNGGLFNYYRNNDGSLIDESRVATPSGSFVGAADFGYRPSAMKLVWEEFTLRQDRAAAFQIEEFDNEESGGNLVASGVTEIARTTLVPEVDAYCLSTIAGYTNANLGNLVAENIVIGTASTKQANPVAALDAGITYLKKQQVPLNDQIAFCSCDFMSALRQTSENGIVKPLLQSELGKDVDTTFEITKFMGIKLIEVEPNRLRTNISLLDTGMGGYTWGSGSKQINFLIVSKSAVMHIVKYEKTKVISGEANLAGRGFDGYTVFTRIYHDVFVPDNKRVGIYCSVAYSDIAAPGVKLDILLNAKSDIESITYTPGNMLYFVGISSDATQTVGTTLTNFTPVAEGYHVTETTTFLAVDSSKKVVATQTVTP